MPNIGQIVEIDPVQMNAAHAVTTNGAGDNRSGQPVWLFKLAIEPPAKLADKESGHTCPRIDRGEDEQRLEHDREVIPILHQSAETGNAVENLRDAECERHRAARAAANFLA